ncbi:hypothetical protein ACFPRL_31490 [Pseudoclavibacter helvolus]
MRLRPIMPDAPETRTCFGEVAWVLMTLTLVPSVGRERNAKRCQADPTLDCA